MNQQEYNPKCNGCKLSQGCGEPLGGVVIKLDGDWTLNHFGGGFLGWLALQPRFHRMDLNELNEKEVKALGVNLKLIREALKSYWNDHFNDDPLERVYVVYLFESAFNPSEHWHLHLHIIPRTKQLGRFKSGYGKPWVVAAWNIASLVDKYWFPPEYQIRKKDSLEIDKEKVKTLMEYLELHLQGK